MKCVGVSAHSARSRVYVSDLDRVGRLWNAVGYGMHEHVIGGGSLVRLNAIEAKWVIQTLGIGEIGGTGGQCPVPDGLPVYQIGAGFDGDEYPFAFFRAAEG